MKKIYLTLLSSVLILGASAQKFEQTGRYTLPSSVTNRQLTKASKSANISRATTITSEQVNPIDLYTSYHSTTAEFGLSGPLWPDSNVRVKYSNGIAAPQEFAVGQVFDFDGLITGTLLFNPNIKPFAINENYTVDSIEVTCFYRRLNNTYSDTAIINVVSGVGNFTGAILGSNPDSAKFVIDYTSTAQTAYAGSLGTYKVVLDSAFYADSASNGLHVMTVNSNLLVSGAHRGLLGVTVDFKPGKVITATDTVFVNVNSLSVLDASPSGTGTDFVMGQGEDHMAGQVTTSGINKYTGGANLDYMIPGAFITTTPLGGGASSPYTAQLYAIDIYVTQTNTQTASINELDNGAKLFQNYPNPTSNATTIKYALENAATVSFEVMDVTGKVITSSFEGNKTEGTHSIELNTNSLNAGVYFYSVVINGSRLTKKMTISK
jgi:hypothetical protein